MNKLETINKVMNEFDIAESKYSSFHSLHEGYAILKEEVDELWDLIKQNPSKMNSDKIKEWKINLEKEAIQISSMAIRFINDLL